MCYIQTSAAGVISNQRSQRQLGSVPAAGYFNVAGYVTHAAVNCKRVCSLLFSLSLGLVSGM